MRLMIEWRCGRWQILKNDKHQELNIPYRQQSASVLILRFPMIVQALYKARVLQVRDLPVLIDNTSQVMRTRTSEQTQLLPEKVAGWREQKLIRAVTMGQARTWA